MGGASCIRGRRRADRAAVRVPTVLARVGHPVNLTRPRARGHDSGRMSLLSKIFRTGIVTEPLPARDGQIVHLVREVDAEARRLFGRALSIREVDAGSCNGCEIEITGLMSPVYDSERFGFHFVASPRHADLLLVTGPVTRNMEVPLRKTYEATPDPKLVVAVGDWARSPAPRPASRWRRARASGARHFPSTRRVSSGPWAAWHSPSTPWAPSSLP